MSGDRAGTLISFASDASKLAQHSDAIVDLHQTTRGELYALGQLEDDRVIIQRLGTKGFATIASLTVPPGEIVFGMADAQGHVFVLTSAHLYRLDNEGRWGVRQLTPPFEDFTARASGVSVASPDDGQVAYVGFDRGEFGGGLQLVDLQTGAVRPVGSRGVVRRGEPTRSLEYSPVRAVMGDDADPACVMVATGLSHDGLNEGGVFQVCGDTVNVRLKQEYMDRDNPARRHTEAVTGLARGTTGAWAVTTHALYRLGGNQPARFLIRYRTYPGLSLHAENPGVTVVCGTRNALRCSAPVVAAQ